MEIGPAPVGARYPTEELQRAKNVLAFSVTDTGVGIAPDKQQLIFEAFQQADASTSRTYGGTGLGLTISRELARLLGGEIAVESKPETGSTFTLYLPLDTAEVEPSYSYAYALESGERHEAPTERGTRDLEGTKVLLVDDDARNLFAVTSLLEHHAVNVVAATSAREAIDLLREHRDIAIVLMDIMMPGTDGYEATREIHRIEAFAQLPVIALTAKAMPGDREKCAQAGCADFVPKPVDGERLLAVIRRWTRRGGR
jgi:CheY-like chemotaxis protein